MGALRWTNSVVGMSLRLEVDTCSPSRRYHVAVPVCESVGENLIYVEIVSARCAPGHVVRIRSGMYMNDWRYDSSDQPSFRGRPTNRKVAPIVRPNRQGQTDRGFHLYHQLAPHVSHLDLVFGCTDSW